MNRTRVQNVVTFSLLVGLGTFLVHRFGFHYPIQTATVLTFAWWMWFKE